MGTRYSHPQQVMAISMPRKAGEVVVGIPIPPSGIFRFLDDTAVVSLGRIVTVMGEGPQLLDIVSHPPRVLGDPRLFATFPLEHVFPRWQPNRRHYQPTSTLGVSSSPCCASIAGSSARLERLKHQCYQTDTHSGSHLAPSVVTQLNSIVLEKEREGGGEPAAIPCNRLFTAYVRRLFHDSDVVPLREVGGFTRMRLISLAEGGKCVVRMWHDTSKASIDVVSFLDSLEVVGESESWRLLDRVVVPGGTALAPLLNILDDNQGAVVVDPITLRRRVIATKDLVLDPGPPKPEDA